MKDKKLSAYIEKHYHPIPLFDHPVAYGGAFKCVESAMSNFNIDESFSDYLFKLIDQSALKDSDVYKKANIDRKLFSKLKSASYHPSKQTVIALGLALKLDFDEFEAFLSKAGYALSDAYLFDVIIAYHIKEGIYDFFTINEALLAYDQKLL